MGNLRIRIISRYRPYLWWHIAINQNKKKEKKRKSKKEKILKNRIK